MSGAPVIHFEISGPQPERLRGFFGELFGWSFDVESPVATEVSEQGQYGFVDAAEDGIPGGVGGGAGYPSHALFYVGVPNVAEALEQAVALGGTRVMGPALNPSGALVVGHFRDPEGNLVGVAGPQ